MQRDRRAEVSGPLYQLLVESVVDYAIFALDRTGHVLSWNRGAQRLKGYEASEIIGQHFSVFYSREVAESGFPALELEQAATAGAFEDEGWRVRKDGTRFWANVVITALRDSTDAVVGFAKVTRDLTDRKTAEENTRRLIASEAARLEAERARDRMTRLQTVTSGWLASSRPNARSNQFCGRRWARPARHSACCARLPGMRSSSRSRRPLACGTSATPSGVCRSTRRCRSVRPCASAKACFSRTGRPWRSILLRCSRRRSHSPPHGPRFPCWRAADWSEGWRSGSPTSESSIRTTARSSPR